MFENLAVVVLRLSTSRAKTGKTEAPVYNGLDIIRDLLRVPIRDI